MDLHRTIDTLQRLVAFDTVSTRSNRALIDWVAERLADHGIQAQVQPGDEPGLGVTLTEDLHRAEDYEAAYLPVARRRDGTLTDW